MKTNIYAILISVFAVAGLCRCDNYLDVNTDPSFPQEVNAEVVFPPLFQEMVRGEVYDARVIGQYIQNWAFLSAGNVWDQHGYASGTDTGGEKWRSHYYGLGVNIEEALRDALATGKYGYAGAAKAIRAWSWQTTTDYHGEMILDQAFDTLRYVFEYDPQNEIYEEVVHLCDEAVQYLEMTDAVNTFSRGDLVYRGDRQKWVKFINAIRARNAHHLSNKSNYNPELVISYIDKSFASNADNFSVPHEGTNADNANFNGPLRNNLGNYRQSNYIMSLMRGGPTDLYPGVTDPRLPAMFTASPDGQFRGVSPNTGDPGGGSATTQVPNLWGGVTLNNTQSRPGKYIYQNAAAFPLISFFELQFMKAEAAFIKGDKTMAFDSYRKAIAAHMEFVDALTNALDDTQITTYLASTAVAQTETDLTLSHIMLQKYIALYGHGALETWVDMRRYDYSTDIYTGFTFPMFFSDNGNKPAYRVRPRYNSEYVWNRPSLEAIGATKPDYHTYKPWYLTPE